MNVAEERSSFFLTRWFQGFQRLQAMFGHKAMFWIGVGMLASLGSVFVELGMALFLQLFVVSLGIVKAQSFPSWMPFVNSQPTVLMSVLFLLGIGVLRSTAIFVSELSYQMINNLVECRLRLVSIYEMLFQEKGRFLSATEVNFRLGELIPRVTEGSLHITVVLSFGLLNLSLLVGMLALAFWPAMICIAGIGLIGIVVLALNRVVRQRSLQASQETRELQRGIERVARNWLYIRIARTRQQEKQQLTNAISQNYVNRLQALFLSVWSSNLPPLMGVLLLALVLWVSQTYLKTPGLTLLALFYLFVRFTQMLKIFSAHFGRANQAWPQVEMAMDFFHVLTPEQRKAALSVYDEDSAWSKTFLQRPFQPFSERTQRQKLTVPPALKVEGVTYSYPEAPRPALRDLTLDIPAGSQLGLYGTSGSGKSTLLSLLLGVLEPSRGRVTINGNDASEFFEKFDVPMGYVGAEPFLLEGSLRENLLYGSSEEVEDKALWEALEKAELAATVRELPGQLEYALTENSEGLSTGQKQRLSLARALVQKPLLLFLDEASANLDVDTESAIADSIRFLKGECTVLVISHRHGMLQHADTLIELQMPTEETTSLKQRT